MSRNQILFALAGAAAGMIALVLVILVIIGSITIG